MKKKQYVHNSLEYYYYFIFQELMQDLLVGEEVQAQKKFQQEDQNGYSKDQQSFKKLIWKLRVLRIVPRVWKPTLKQPFQQHGRKFSQKWQKVMASCVPKHRIPKHNLCAMVMKEVVWFARWKGKNTFVACTLVVCYMTGQIVIVSTKTTTRLGHYFFGNLDYQRHGLKKKLDHKTQMICINLHNKIRLFIKNVLKSTPQFFFLIYLLSTRETSCVLF